MGDKIPWTPHTWLCIWCVKRQRSGAMSCRVRGCQRKGRTCSECRWGPDGEQTGYCSDHEPPLLPAANEAAR